MKFKDQRQLHLKIKIKTLVEESKAIKHHEHKFKWANESKYEFPRTRLKEHRLYTVRPHTRINLLAYGILRGTPYSAMEAKCYEQPDFMRVKKIAKSFGATEAVADAWIELAREYLSPKKHAA